MTLPPLSTHRIQAAIVEKRRADAALRWTQSFRPAPVKSARRDVPVARPTRG